MLDKLLHHKLLTSGLEGDGVITEQKVEGSKGQTGALGFYVGVEGHIRFDDGTEAKFSSKFLDTSKVGNIDVGTIVPVRYGADHKHAVLDVPKLEAKREAEKRANAERRERRKAQDIAAADAKLAKGGKGHRNAPAK